MWWLNNCHVFPIVGIILNGEWLIIGLKPFLYGFIAVFSDTLWVGVVYPESIDAEVIWQESASTILSVS